jgi:hypothetical protein
MTMFRTRFVLVLLAVPAVVVLGSDQFCMSSGTCIDSSDIKTYPLLEVITANAECEASDCDGGNFLQHHTDNGIDDDVGVACESRENSETTRANGFLRCFEGDLCGTTKQVKSVKFSVDTTNVNNLAVTINLYKGRAGGCASKTSVGNLHNTLPVASIRHIIGRTGDRFQETVDVSSADLTIAPTESLLVEIAAPDLRNIGKFYLAANKDEQCDASYIVAADCSSFSPRPLSEIQTKNVVSYLIRLDLANADGDGCFGGFILFSIIGCLFNFLFGWLF